MKCRIWFKFLSYFKKIYINKYVNLPTPSLRYAWRTPIVFISILDWSSSSTKLTAPTLTSLKYPFFFFNLLFLLLLLYWIQIKYVYITIINLIF